MSFHMKNAKARRVLQAAAISLFALLASVAHADWDGLNMPEGVTILSKEIYGLHMLILMDLRGPRGGGVRRDDLFDRQVPEIAGRRRRQDTGSQHQGGNHLDRDPHRHPGRHGDTHRQDAHRDRGAQRRADGHQGDRATSGSGNTSTSARTSASFRPSSATATPRASSARASIPTRFLTTCSTWTTRWSSRRAPRSASS